MTTTKVCKDCLTEWAADPDAPAKRVRPAPHPGPRCATHHRQVRNTRKAHDRGRRLAERFAITTDTYEQLAAAQGGVCAICQRATGRTRALSVDHDHTCCDSRNSCGQCVRGLLCRPCNDMLGHLRDDPAAFRRAADYLEQPPAAPVLAAAGDVLHRLGTQVCDDCQGHIEAAENAISGLQNLSQAHTDLATRATTRQADSGQLTALLQQLGQQVCDDCVGYVEQAEDQAAQR